MKYYIDVKMVIWERWELLNETKLTEEEIVKIIELDPLDIFMNSEVKVKRLIEADETLFPENNNGQATVELYTEIKRDNTHKPIWDNVLKWIS